MVSLAAIAALGASIGVGAVSAVHGNPVLASHAAPPGLSVALSRVPTWTHAHEVLAQNLSKYAAGATGGGGVASGLGVGLKKAGAKAAASHARAVKAR
ncbi:MAG: hypothetical protein QW767_00595 [Thermoprotei archaeon]